MAAIKSLTPEQQHAVATRYDRACRLLAQRLPEQALPLLLDCCQIDPSNLTYRKMLRVAQREQRLKQPLPALAVWLLSWGPRRRMRKARQRGRHQDTILQAEHLLTIDPKNVSAHTALAAAFEGLGWIDQAILGLEQARIALPDTDMFNPDLARLCARRGSFTQARQLLEGGIGPTSVDLDTFRQDLAIAEEKLRARPDDPELPGIR
jgi:tetratricopeptide (TPR) repeat protein